MNFVIFLIITAIAAGVPVSRATNNYLFFNTTALTDSNISIPVMAWLTMSTTTYIHIDEEVLTPRMMESVNTIRVFVDNDAWIETFDISLGSISAAIPHTQPAMFGFGLRSDQFTMESISLTIQPTNNSSPNTNNSRYIMSVNSTLETFLDTCSAASPLRLVFAEMEYFEARVGLRPRDATLIEWLSKWSLVELGINRDNSVLSTPWHINRRIMQFLPRSMTICDNDFIDTLPTVIVFLRHIQSGTRVPELHIHPRDYMTASCNAGFHDVPDWQGSRTTRIDPLQLHNVNLRFTADSLFLCDPL